MQPASFMCLKNPFWFLKGPHYSLIVTFCNHCFTVTTILFSFLGLNILFLALFTINTSS